MRLLSKYLGTLNTQVGGKAVEQVVLEILTQRICEKDKLVTLSNLHLFSCAPSALLGLLYDSFSPQMRLLAAKTVLERVKKIQRLRLDLAGEIKAAMSRDCALLPKQSVVLQPLTDPIEACEFLYQDQQSYYVKNATRDAVLSQIQKSDFKNPDLKKLRSFYEDYILLRPLIETFGVDCEQPMFFALF